jgi:hypothetical protein
MEIIMIDKPVIFYNIYKQLYNSNELEYKKKKIILRALFVGEKWSWKVIGISKKTFNIYKDNNFKKVKKKFERHHFVPFAETAKEMFQGPLLTTNLWWKLINKNEKTHLISIDEHKKGNIYEYFEIPTKHKLFANTDVGWDYTLKEELFLKKIIIGDITWKTKKVI